MIDPEDARTWTRVSWLRNGDAYASASGTWRQHVYPVLADMIPEEPELSILDYGAGHGPFAELLVQRGYGDISLFDPSSALLDLARTNSPTSYKTCSSDRDAIADRFDVIVFCAVWMALDPIQCREALTWMKGRLEPGGRVVFAATHPCFRSIDRAGYSTTFEPSAYNKSGCAFDVYMETGDSSGIVFSDYHYTLAEMFEQARACGLYLGHLREVSDQHESTRDREGSLPSWICGTLSPPECLGRLG